MPPKKAANTKAAAPAENESETKLNQVGVEIALVDRTNFAVVEEAR